MIKAGQRLWFAATQRRQEYLQGYVTVEKVGRKWATLDNGHKIDVITLRADGGGYCSPGTCFESKEEWEADVARQRAWSEFRSLVDRTYTTPEKLATHQIEEWVGVLREVTRA